MKKMIAAFSATCFALTLFVGCQATPNGSDASANSAREISSTEIGAVSIDATRQHLTADEAKAGKGYTIQEVDGIKIAFVAFTKGMDGMTLPKGSENCVNVLYKDYDSTYHSVDKAKINKILDAAEREKPDATVVLLHWGSEYSDIHSKSQTTIQELMFKEGKMSGVAEKVSFREKSGFRAERISGKAIVGGGKTIVEDLHIGDGWSDVNLSSFMMSYRNSEAFAEFITDVKLEGQIEQSTLDFTTMS